MPDHTPETSTHSGRSPQVHPRVVWGGVTVALAGCLILGVGIVMLVWWVSLTGEAMTALGMAIGVRGGALRDARPEFLVGMEVREVRKGRVHRGVAAGEMIDDPEVRADALRTSTRVNDLLGRRRRSDA